MQTKIALTGVSEDRVVDVIMAYEPVWAIGEHGVPASEEYANQKHEVIREVLVQMYPAKGESIPVLYGGSVNPGNATPLIAQPFIDGLFIGRAAWNAGQFSALIREVRAAWKSRTTRG